MFPNDKNSLKIKTKGLPNLAGRSEEVFEFRFILQYDGIKLTIPGTPRGLDVVIPSSEEQEKWLREIEKRFESGFKEVWYCLWEIENERIIEEFIKIIEPNIIEKEYI